MSKLVYFSQKDPRWKDIMYSIRNDKKQTIGTSACGPTSAAMAISSLTGQTVLPTTAATYALNNGYRTNDTGTSWSYFASIAKKYGLTCKQTGSLSEVKKALGEGKLVVASMGKGNFTGGGHYILLVGMAFKDGYTWINVFDPNHSYSRYGTDGLIDQGVKNDGKVSAKEIVFAKQAKQYWIFSNQIKEDGSMNAEEKKAFEALQTKVTELEKQLTPCPAPKWFVSEFGSADLGGLIADPKFTKEGWRSLAVGLRARNKK
ncbi:C39 family peptidase [Paenibacillus azoreducens]|uniref:C39 family peptidase n=1 Tax=Paenibacillus azoreducens TaxID=116718 RepID=UPI0039F57F18